MTFRGRLKFHRPEFHSRLTRAAFEFAFPGFLQPRSPDPLKLEQLRRQAGAARAMAQPRNNRRFAADFTLAAGAYFGTCQDTPDEDSDTVLNEIKAYRDPRRSGRVRIFDANDDRIVHDFTIPDGWRHSFLILIEDLKRFRAQCPRGGAVEVDWDAPDRPAFLTRYTIEYREIARTVDLRELVVRNWFFETFRLGDRNILIKPNGGNAADFNAMLPTLLDPRPGGNATTNAIGMWMRKAGVNALVYPSARSDTGVRCENGRVTDSVGWNLVDYRGTSSLELTDAFLDLSPWMTDVLPGVRYAIAPEADHRHGSWQVRGVVQAHSRHYEERLALA